MTDHTDHSDAEPTGETYEPPLAVRLSDVATGAGGNCGPGTTALIDQGHCASQGSSAWACDHGDDSTCCVNGADFGDFRSPRRMRGPVTAHLGPTRT